MKEKENENILERAVKALKNEQVPPRPPQQTVDATIAKLTEASTRPNTGKPGKRIQIIERIKATKSFTKVAAAAVLLIVAGYTVGWLSAPRPPDAEQLQAVLEPAIRQSLLDEMKQYWQLALASSYVHLKDELSQQYRHDLNQFAIQTLAASNAVTNQLLTELIESINAAQTQDRQWVAAAFEQIELNRLRDNAQLSNAFATFAVQTEDELQRTKQDMAQFLADTQSGRLPPDVPESSNIPK
jgi:hypothetical protein